MYSILPETEHRSLEDIELHYSDNGKQITDINIRINRIRQLDQALIKLFHKIIAFDLLNVINEVIYVTLIIVV